MGHHQLLFTGAQGPGGVGGVAGWWKADALVGYVDTNIITSWPDSSGHGSTLTANANPTYRTNIINGKPVVRFTGISCRVGGTMFETHPTAMTCFVVSKQTSLDANYQRVVAASNVSTGFQLFRQQGDGRWGFYSASSTDQPAPIINGSGPLATADIVRATTHTSTFATLAINGGLGTLGMAFDPTEVNYTATNEIYIGSNSANEGFVGDIAEVIVYHRALTPAEAAAVEAYLAAKYAITLYSSSPERVSGLVAWYDFAEANNLFGNTTRTIMALTNNPILGVLDKSGSGNHLSEATNGPNYSANIQNGRSVARFDGVNDVLSATVAATAAQTIFIVLRKTTAVNNSVGTVFFRGDGSNAVLTTYDVTEPTGYTWIRNEATANQALTNTAVTTAQQLVLTATASSMVSRVNGGAAVTTFDPHDSITTGATVTFANDGFDGPLKGDYDISEFILYNSVLSLANINLIGQYLATKWGLTWTTAT